MSAADDTDTTRPSPTSGCTWVQLYRGDQAVGVSMPITITEAISNVGLWTELVQAKYPELNDVSAARLTVYRPCTPLIALNNSAPLRLGVLVPGGTTEEQPFIVIAPPAVTQHYVWIQLYVGDQEIELVMRFLCEHDSIVTDLTNLVKEKRSVLLHHCDGAELSVYPPGTRLDAQNNVSRLDPNGPVLHGTTKEHPLIVRAPSAVTQHVMPFDNVTAQFGFNVPKTELKKDDLVEVFRQEGDIIKLTPLFIRKHLVEQRDILSKFLSSKKYNQLYVSGPPGCGKTSFIWLWARMHAANEKKRALVIQYRPRNACHVFRFEADGRIFRKRSNSYEYNIVADLETLLTEEGAYDLCVFDGVRQNLSHCSNMLSVVNGAPNITKKINVTSLAFTMNGGDQSLGWDTTLQFTAFDSWTECDYKEAVKYDHLASMLMILETPSEGEFSRRRSTLLPDSSVVGRREVVLDEVSTAMSRKYYYAGGSARYMFEYTLIGLKETLESLLTSIESDNTWERFVNEVVSPNTPTAVNTLMQQFKMACAPLSKYVLIRAYEKMSKRLTDAVKSVGEKTKNPSIRGWAFELEQLGIIKNAVQANTKMAVHSGAGLIIQPISEVEYAGGKSALDKAVVQGVTVIWCSKWNQGCFDAAIYDNGTLITLQFTVSISHSVKLEHLTELRETLLKSELPVNDIFHAAIVPKDNLQRFAFGTPEGLGYQNKSELPLYTVRVCKSCAFALQTDDNGMEAKKFHCMLVGEDFEVHGPRKRKRSHAAVTLSS